MKPVSKERAAWLGRNIFPHEAALRAWLSRRPLAEALDIDDVIQESYAILASRACLDHIVSPRSYLFQVAKTVVLQAMRRSRIVSFDALAEVELLQIPCETPSPEQIAADRQELHRIESLVSALPPRCREVFVLRKIRGLSQREIAAQLGIAESTVEKHIGKALSILANAVGRGGKSRFESSRDSERHFEVSEGSETRQRDGA